MFERLNKTSILNTQLIRQGTCGSHFSKEFFFKIIHACTDWFCIQSFAVFVMSWSSRNSTVLETKEHKIMLFFFRYHVRRLDKVRSPEWIRALQSCYSELWILAYPIIWRIVSTDACHPTRSTPGQNSPLTYIVRNCCGNNCRVLALSIIAAASRDGGFPWK